MKTAAAGSGVVEYLEAGSGMPLVLLHGIGSNARSFQDQLGNLSDRFRVIAWNAPGYGNSTPLDPDAPDAGAYAERLGAFLDALGIQNCHLAGHSLGCLIAARFAVSHPQRILSLSLSSIAGGHAGMAEEERRKLLESRLADVAELGARGMAEKRGPRLLAPEAKPEMIRRVVDAMAAINPGGYAQAARMLSGGDAKADIRRLPADMPVQIIYGEGDVITPPARNREIAALRPQAPVTVIPAAGHALYLEQPDLFSRALGDFALAA